MNLEQLKEKKWTLFAGFGAVVVLYLVSSFLGSETVVESANQMAVAAETNSVTDSGTVSLSSDLNTVTDSMEADVAGEPGSSTATSSEAVLLKRPEMEVLPATGPKEEEESRVHKVEEDRRISDLRKSCEEQLRRGQWKRAFEGLSRLVSLRPYNADYHLTLGLVHRRLHPLETGNGHLQEASAKFQEYIDYGGQEAIAFLLLAETAAVSGDDEVVYRHLDEAASRGMNIARAVDQFPALARFTEDTRFVRSALKLERYLLKDGAHRDPFTAPWKSSSFVDSKGSFSFLEVSEQRELLAQARAAISRVEFSVREGEHENAAEAYKVIMKISEDSNRFDQPELASELKAIGDRLDDLEDGVAEIRVRHLYEESRDRLDLMKRAFADHEFDTVHRLHTEIQRFARDIEEAGEPYLTTSTLVGLAARQLLDRSEVVRDFLSRTIDIDGVAISGEGSHAIVDGQWIALGGEIQGAVLQEVHRDRLVFLFEGEVIERRFGRF
ncbi:hypothetical protein CBD41_00605 [bacterium TMED181]|nr:hypothetical protein [Planctomycetota bacterium]OUW47634.1 MAG: hypothetical protein CBD41_00605 [bacterium TMED181]